MTRRGTLILGAPVLAVVLLALANVFALRTFDLMAAEAGGFVAFVNAIGLLTLTAVAVGTVIAWRVPENRIGPLLIGGALVALSVFVCWPLTVYAYFAESLPLLLTGAIAWWANVSLLPAMFILFPTVALLFPDGRLPHRRWRAPYAVAVALIAVGILLTTIAPWVAGEEQPVPNPFALPGVPTVLSEIGGGLAALAVFLGFALAVAGMVARFRRGDGVERAQLKWLMAAVALMSVVFPISFGTDIGPSDLMDLASVLVGVLMPLAIGVAILRYRLYEIDRIISRTLGWAIVTGLLVTVFAAGVVALQAALAGFTQGQTLAVAAATLVAFALFQPVRRRVQGAVDRRFDRARYDAERTAVAFAERLRDETDIATVTDDLSATTRAALAPAKLSIWLRATGR